MKCKGVSKSVKKCKASFHQFQGVRSDVMNWFLYLVGYRSMSKCKGV